MLKLLALAAAGALGTLARYGLSGLIHRHGKDTFPFGTLVVNLLGCLLIGLVMHLAREHGPLTPDVRVVIVAGVLGGFTTFSAFGYETFELVQAGALVSAGCNAAVSVLGGLAAVWLGSAAGRALGL